MADEMVGNVARRAHDAILQQADTLTDRYSNMEDGQSVLSDPILILIVVFVASVLVYSGKWLLWMLVSIVLISVQWMFVLYQFTRVVLTLLALTFVRIGAGCWSLLTRLKRFNYGVEILQRSLSKAESYQEWFDIALQIDQLREKDLWRNVSDARPQFDSELLVHNLQQLKTDNTHDLVHAFRGILKRFHGGIDNPSLYQRSLTGTKTLIHNFVDTAVERLEYLCNSKDSNFPKAEKFEFFEKAEISLGRTALCLSGGGSLAMYHLGVVKALLEGDCLPNIISGASGGSIVAAMLACKTNAEMIEDVIQPDISTRYKERWFPPIIQQLSHFIKHGVLMSNETFKETTLRYYGTMTFEEAFQRTGRVVNITVSRGGPSGGGGRGLLMLNHVSAPDVLLASAVSASCALPGIMHPVEILSKDRTGKLVPSFPRGVHWIDGSIQADLPMLRLAEMFGVNNFIVSQVNPHVVPFVRRGKAGRSYPLLRRTEDILNMDVVYRTRVLAKLGLVPRFFGHDIRTVFKQKYQGNITITPNGFLQQVKAFGNPTVNDMKHYILEGARSTWPWIPMIQCHTKVEREIGRCIRKVKPLILHKYSDEPVVKARRRVDSHAPMSPTHSESSGSTVAGAFFPPGPNETTSPLPVLCARCKASVFESLTEGLSDEDEVDRRTSFLSQHNGGKRRKKTKKAKARPQNKG